MWGAGCEVGAGAGRVRVGRGSGEGRARVGRGVWEFFGAF